MAGFAAATTVVASAERTYDVQLDPQWTVAGRPHGGYLLALLARAAVHSTGGTGHPVAASAHFATTPRIGPAVVSTEVLRVGRSTSQVRARLSEDGRLCAEALLTLGRLDPGSDPAWVDEAAPALPPPRSCFTMPVEPPGADFRVEVFAVAQVRLDPAVAGFTTAEPDNGGELRGWLTFPDGSEPDPFALLFAVDSVPPATFTIRPSGWVPTLELTAYVRALPAPGPLRVRQRVRLVAGGRVDEVCDVWDSQGSLVAQATQLASIRFR